MGVHPCYPVHVLKGNREHHGGQKGAAHDAEEATDGERNVDDHRYGEDHGYQSRSGTKNRL